MNIPNTWTFENKEIAGSFDDHVREQLPWYDLVTKAIAVLVRHYLPVNGTAYDIGASTGNIGKAIEQTLTERHAKLVAVEESKEMASRYVGPGELITDSVQNVQVKNADVIICNLVLMFVPVCGRNALIDKLYRSLNIGGALIIVDKCEPQSGYIGTALYRLTLSSKLDCGANPADVMNKEISLAGIQRPLSTQSLPAHSVEFFRMGDFAGWIVESKRV